MKRLFQINLLLVLEILVFLTLLASQSIAFEESIFEDEDIYRKTLPPPRPLTGITVPGTKWCGPGRISTSYNDLGRHRETDMCCRDHDTCSDILKAKSTLHGLRNEHLLPILKCSCEQKFINCLQAVNNTISTKLGRIYYTVKKHCIDEGYPIVGCLEYQKGTIRQRCIRYEVDEKQPKIWQLYDMPFYTHNIRNELENAAKYHLDNF